MSTTSAAILLDRFVSASSAADATDSLQAILDVSDQELLSEIFLADNVEGLDCLLQIVQGTLNGFTVQEGPALACRIYIKLFQSFGRKANVFLQQPSPPGRLVQTLLDVVTPPSSDSDDALVLNSYARVLGLQVLEQICTTFLTLAQQQLLSTPNGLHRLAELMSERVEESVRNQALLVLLKTAKWPSCAKILIFCEVCDTALDLALAEGGLTDGHVIVQDCLELCRLLLSHDPTSIVDLVLSSSGTTLPQHLASLLDLRGGSEFRNPKPIVKEKEDDLDEILKGDSSTKPSQAPTPRLTKNEELVLEGVFEVLNLLLCTRQHQETIWKQHPGLSSLVWELALVSPPPHNVPPPCAMPSPSIQQGALQLVSQRFYQDETMERHNGMDRLLYLVCTGGGATAKTFEDKLALSLSALHVLRNTLSSDKATLLVGHTLAPPNMGEDDQQASPPPPTVVQKLLNTVLENMEAPPEEGNAMLERRRINLLGSLGALGLFLTIAGDTTREMMLRITEPLQMLDSILKSLEQQDDFITLALLKFLCEWMESTPAVVKAVLLSTYSTSVGVLFQTTSSGDAVKGQVSTMSGLLLGLAMDGIGGQNEGSDEEEFGGWTKQGILSMISNRKGGISGYTAALESLKKESSLPWSACKLESQVFQTWYKTQVHTIRKRVVQELTTGGQAEDDDDTDVGEVDGASVKSLRKLMSQQSAELLELQASLATAQATIESQKEQLDTWKRRVESNPTQLDDMLSEFTTENEELKKEVTSLKESLVQKEKDKQSQLEEIQEWKDREREAREERDTIRGEMEALSSAYHTLEVEFNLRVGGTPSTAAAAPTDESADATTTPGQQPQGEVSRQQPPSDSTREESEVLSSLREENTRLRTDAVAADEWMAMAMQRMNEIGGQNVTLQQEVSTLRQQLEATDGSGTVQAAAIPGHSIQHDDARIQQLETQLANSQKDVASALESLSKSKSDREELATRLDGLQGDLARARAENSSLRDEVNKKSKADEVDSNAMLELRMERDALVNSKNEEVALLQKEIDSLQLSLMTETNSNKELTSLRESVSNLQNEVATVRKELSDTIKREGEEIQRRDATILDLEGKLARSQQEPSRIGEDIKKRDDEISSLKTANEAAQEWMAKAVEHHTMMSEQLSALGEDKIALNKEITQLRSTVTETERRLDSVQKEKEAKENELVRQHSQALPSQDEVTELQEQLAAAKSESSLLRVQQANYEHQVAALESEKEAALQNVKQLSSDVDKHGKEKDCINEQLLAARRVISEKDAEIRSIQVTPAAQKLSESEIQNLRGELSERDQRIETLKAQVTETRAAQADASSLRNEIAEMKKNSDRLSSNLATLQSEAVVLREKNAALEKANDELGQLKRNLEEAGDKSKASLDQMQMDMTALQTERDSLKEQCGEHVTTEEGLKSQLEEFRSWTDLAQKKIAELQAEAAKTEELGTLRTELDAATVQLNELRTERDGLIDEQGQLKSQIDQLTIETGNWQGKCMSLEQNQKVLEKQVGEYGEKAKEVDDITELLNAKEEELSEALDELNLVREENQEMQDQSTDVVGQWKARAEELEATVKELELDLEKQEQEATGAVSQWEERCSVLEQECAAKTGRHEELDAVVSEMEAELEKQQQEAIDAVSQWESRCSALQERCQQLESGAHTNTDSRMLDDLEEQLRDKDDALDEAVASQSVLRKELEEAHDSSEEVVRQWKDRAAELEGEVSELKKSLSQQSTGIANDVAQWEKRCSELQDACVHLELEVDSASKERVALSEALKQAKAALGDDKGMLSKLQSEVEDKREKITLLQSEVEEKESLLTASSEQLENERKSWLSDKESLKTQLEEQTAARTAAEDDIEAMDTDFKEMREQYEDVVDQWKGRVEELEALVKESDKDLEQQQAEATEAISQWEIRCSDLEEKLMQQESNLEETTAAALKSLRVELEQKHAMLDASANELSEQRKSWEKQRDEYERGKESASSLIATVRSELEETMKEQVTLREELKQVQNDRDDLERELEEEREHAADLAGNRTIADQRINLVSTQLKAEKTAKVNAETRLASQLEQIETLERQLDQMKSERSMGDSQLSVELEAAYMARSEAEEALKALEQRERENKYRWDSDRDAHEKEKASLQDQVGELQVELKKSYDMVQSLVTDEVSERATEIAAVALRDQIDDMRSQLESDRSAYMNEKNAREAAETEVKRLQSDLAVLIEMNGENGEIDPQRLTFQVADKVRKKQKQEIDSLRKALEKALQELATSREKEREAEQKASASRMQASVCEQEIITAKADLSFLTQTMEELREAEANGRESLEHQIGALENDKKRLKRSHADELENLRNELTHISIERDRALQLLKDSEKKIESLTHSISAGRDEDETQANEVQKLRVEKAQLLAAVTEEGTKTEHRIREAVTATAARIEADVILERELRVAAEAALEDMKTQVEELQSHKTEAFTSEDDVNNYEAEKELNRDLLDAKEETDKLKEQNSSLQERLEKAEDDAKSITEITEQCRKAQAKVLQLERDDRFNAEVNVELARLRAEANRSAHPSTSDSWVVVCDNPAEEDGSTKETLSAIEAYDWIKKQKMAIAEEREMYFEFIEEHDDLLALLAQFQLEKGSLVAALKSLGGQDAVDSAINEAEQSAVKQYGNFVRISES